MALPSRSSSPGFPALSGHRSKRSWIPRRRPLVRLADEDPVRSGHAAPPAATSDRTPRGYGVRARLVGTKEWGATRRCRTGWLRVADYHGPEPQAPAASAWPTV